MSGQAFPCVFLFAIRTAATKTFIPSLEIILQANQLTDRCLIFHQKRFHSLCSEVK